MKTTYYGLIVTILMTSGFSGFAQDSPATPISQMPNETSSIFNTTMKDIAPTMIDPMALLGVWIVYLEDKEFTMALNQSNYALYGQAKFEGSEPWNGVVTGSLSGNVVQISVAALQGKNIVSIYMNAIAEGDLMHGSYLRYALNDKTSGGEFAAKRIRQDTSAYKPAIVEASEQTVSVQPSAEQTTVQANKRSFKDVRDLARGIDPNILPRSAPL